MCLLMGFSGRNTTRHQQCHYVMDVFPLPVIHLQALAFQTAHSRKYLLKLPSTQVSRKEIYSMGSHVVYSVWKSGLKTEKRLHRPDQDWKRLDQQSRLLIVGNQRLQKDWSSWTSAVQTSLNWWIYASNYPSKLSPRPLKTVNIWLRNKLNSTMLTKIVDSAEYYCRKFNS